MPSYETPEEVAKFAEMDPELIEFLKAGGQPVGIVGGVEQSVARFQAMSPADPPATATDGPLDITMRDGHINRARVYRSSKPPSGPSPLVIFIFGGGWMLGDPLQVAVAAKSIAEETGAVVVAPNYRLAPKHPFPAGPDDIWDAYTWLAQPANAATLGADVSAGVIIGGISAGGNMSAVTAQRFVTEQPAGVAPPTGLALVVPYLLEAEHVPQQYRHLYIARTQNAGALSTSEADMQYTQRTVQPDFSSPQFSPFNAPRPHTGMPPVYFQACGLDPLRDDSLIYDRVLRDHGVKTRLDVYPGLPHAHLIIFPTLKASRRAYLDLVKGVAWLLGKDIGDEEAAKAFDSESVAEAKTLLGAII